MTRDASLHWVDPPRQLRLSKRDVHLWRVALEQPQRLVQKLSGMLSGDEREKAERFHFERHQRRYTVARGMLRMILSYYLELAPQDLRFHYGLRGKPELADGLGDGSLRFNVSHSHELALYAFTRDREIGVDVEYLRPMPDAEPIAARFFSPAEHSELCRLPTNQKQLGFFNGWTRKEAYIKALGDGLYYALDRFQVSLTPEEPPRLIVVEDDPGQAARWSLQALTPAEGYVAALAVEGRGWDLSGFQGIHLCRCKHAWKPWVNAV